MANKGSNATAVGCAGVVLVVAALWVLFKAIAALFLTPIPYILIAGAGVYYVVRRFRRERLEKLYWDVVAGIQGGRPWHAETDQALWARGRSEPDVLVLQGACLANGGNFVAATECLDAAAREPAKIGRLSGGVGIWLPRQVEPIWFGNVHSRSNLNLARGHFAVLHGDARVALEWLNPRLHEPHYAAALASLADAYSLGGWPARGVAGLKTGLFRVANSDARTRLRYKLADMLESLGAVSDAAAELRILASEDSFGPAPQRLARLEAKLRDEHSRRIAEADAATYRTALTDFQLARGPKSRDAALERGLAQLGQAHLREQLLIEASRLEVEAVLDKVAGLKTKSAKLRNLHEAIDRIRADPVSDHLQTAEIAELERALDEVEAG